MHVDPGTDTPPPRPILVCGLGIIGLTAAVRLLQAGHAVVAVAAHLPPDPPAAAYASPAAGAHHLSFAADGDGRQRRLDWRTFEVMWGECGEGGGSGLMRVVQREFWGTEGERHVRFFEGLPDFRVYEPSELPAFAKHAVSFTSLTMDPAPYLAKLRRRFTALGGTTHRATLPALAAALRFAPTARAIVNCTGLGSLTLEDVRDAAMHPVRGQVVVLRAPWVAEGRTLQVGGLAGGEGGARTYVIPRRSGEVVIGGTREVGDWTPDPRPETTRDIKRRALAIFPELVPPGARVAGRVPCPEDLDGIVVREVVGLRPARVGGLRLERGGDLVVGDPGSGAGGRRVPVVHNIGHSGAGWQCSWGCAEEVVRLVEGL